MTKAVKRLTDLRIRRATKAGMYPDGAGLYLQVRGSNARSWILRYMLNGKAREMGLGSYPEMGLDDARQQAEDCRRLRNSGIDPIDRRKADRAAQQLDQAKAITFSDCAARYIAGHRAGWRNEKHAAQWESTLATYAEPTLGKLSADAVSTELILRILEPIWKTKTETANRVRGRIEMVLDWAKARGYRTGDNPARWRGHLDKLLPKRSKLKKVKHHPSLPYAELPAFMLKLRSDESTAARALEFAILTASRATEAVKAKGEEINERDGLWSVPDSRMKSGVGHIVPLSERATTIAKAQIKAHGKSYIFPGLRAGKALTDAALLVLLDRTGFPDITTHGFRSTFKTWAAECTAFPRDVVEKALAHTLEDKTEAAYMRGELLEKRRKLMDAWAKYCSSAPVSKSGNVVSIRAGKR